ncbi:MAG: hypothetical protein MUF87_09900 [Anaerolineae bacterium]|jgi:uncharacterized membrane protein YozB (DUF420 family)|nr:hypothetical protein [Anaerolineae bacterium]
MFNQPGFLGTGATLASDLTLLAYILLIVPSMLIGFVFARRKWFVPHHKLMMTFVTVLNWLFIIAVMLVSYSAIAPEVPRRIADPIYVLPTIHLVTGATAQLLATYLVLRMWLEKVLPTWIMVKNIKTYMRFTLALWLITAALGVTIYAVWYVRPASATDGAITPLSTPDVLLTPEITPEVLLTPEITPDVMSTPDVIATEEVMSTPDVILTPEITPESNATRTAAIFPPRPPVLTPDVTPDLRPVLTPDVTPEVDDDDDNDNDDNDDNDVDDDDDNDDNDHRGGR